MVCLVDVGLFGSRWFIWFALVCLVHVCLVGVSKTGTRTHNVHHSIDLCDPPEDLRMQCQWYHETRKGSGKYVPSAGTVNIDKKFVHVSSCLGLVDLVWSNSVYTMKDNGQMERFIRLMRTIS